MNVMGKAKSLGYLQQNIQIFNMRRVKTVELYACAENRNTNSLPFNPLWAVLVLVCL